MRGYGILAVDNNLGFGKNNALPWSYRKDMELFKNTTLSGLAGFKNVVVMGYNTWVSIGQRPLKDRYNIVLCNDKIDIALQDQEDLWFVYNISEIKDRLNGKSAGVVFYIGGISLFKRAWDNLDIVYVTSIKETHDCDVFFPKDLYEKLGKNFTKTVIGDYVEDRVHLEFASYIRKGYKN